MLLGCAALVAVCLYVMNGSRALYFALAPTLVIYGTMNWDLLAVAFATLGSCISSEDGGGRRRRARGRRRGEAVSGDAGAPLIVQRLRDRRPDDGWQFTIASKQGPRLGRGSADDAAQGPDGTLPRGRDAADHRDLLNGGAAPRHKTPCEASMTRPLRGVHYEASDTFAVGVSRRWGPLHPRNLKQGSRLGQVRMTRLKAPPTGTLPRERGTRGGLPDHG